MENEPCPRYQPFPKLEFHLGSFATNAIGTLVIDRTDPTGNTLYAGTGESHASADSEAGFGIYKTTDGGATWTHLAAHTDVPAGSGVDCDAVFGVPPGTFGFQTAPAYSGPAFDGRAISSIIINPNNPNILYVGSTRAVRGVSSVLSGGAVSLAPGLPPYGIWKSTDGGANFTLLNYQDVCLNPTLPGSAGIIQASFGSTRGVNRVEFDPSTSSTIYAAAFPQNFALPLNTKGGVWRSRDSGATIGGRSRAHAIPRLTPIGLSLPSRNWRTATHGCTWASVTQVTYPQTERGFTAAITLRLARQRSQI